jgi:hypothetical protein
MEASGNTLWFERLLAGLGHQIRMGDASKIRAMEVRKTEDGSAGCGAVAEVAAGKPVSGSLGTESGDAGFYDSSCCTGTSWWG